MHDNLFIISAIDDCSIGLYIMNGNIIIRDFDFKNRFSGVFIKYNNIPEIMTCEIQYYKIILDSLLINYNESLFRKKYYNELYNKVISVCKNINNNIEYFHHSFLS